MHEELLKEVEARLSETCKCGHGISEDHYHGECEIDDCPCIMADLDAQLEADTDMIRRLADALRGINAAH